MSTKKGADNAAAQITDPIDTPAQMVTAGNKIISGIKASPNYPKAPELQGTIVAWDNENNNLDAANKNVALCENNLAAARADQAATVRRWQGRARGSINAVNVYCDGSKDLVQSFAMDVAERKESPLETVPQELRGVRSKMTGTATARWKTHRANHGYVVQYATDPADPATYSAPCNWTKGTFELPGQTPGALINFRVAAVDPRLPGGQTAYTPWVAVMVSS